MNAEIVRVLEIQFPPPPSFAERVEDLFDLADALKKSRGDGDLLKLAEKVEATVVEIARGRLNAGDDVDRDELKRVLEYVQVRRGEKQIEHIEGFLDDDEV